MPAGLDGSPDPVVTSERTAVLESVASAAEARRQAGVPLLVGVDGIDGSGKSTFADELAAELAHRGLNVVRSTIDSFHNPRAVRYRRGPSSPVGFFLDSHDLDAVQDRLLKPFAAGQGDFVPAVFDSVSDLPIAVEPQSVGPDDVLIFDGIFAQREELASYWDLVIFADAQARVDLSRLVHVLEDLPSDPMDVVKHVLEWREKMDRYTSGMRYYLDAVDPMASADIVIDNNNFQSPKITKGP